MSDFFIHLLFESFWLLAVVGAIACIVALAIHRRAFTSKSRTGLWATVAGVLVLFILQYLVVTDREAIEAMIRALAHAVDDGDMAAISQHLDETFISQGWDKETFLARVDQTLQRWEIDEAGVSGFKIEFADGGAAVTFRAYCDLRSESNAQPNVMSRWKVHCIRRADVWKLDQILSGTIGITDATGYDVLNELR